MELSVSSIVEHDPHGAPLGNAARSQERPLRRLCVLVLAILGVGSPACVTAQETAAVRAFRSLPPRSPVDDRDRALAAAPTPLSDFAALVRAAVTRSPALDAAWYEAQAATLGIAGTRRMPNPRVSLTAFVLPVETRVGPQRLRVGASQVFPWPSKLTSAADAASARAAVARKRFELAHAQLVRALRVPWIALAERSASADLIRAQAEVVAQIRSLTELRSATTKTSYGAITQLALREEELRERARSFDDQATALGHRVRALAHLPAESVLPPATLDDATMVGELPANLTSATHASPAVGTAQAELNAAEAQRIAAGTRGGPDFDVAAMWTYVGDPLATGVPDAGQDVVAITFGVRIPLWQSAYDADEAAAVARREAASARVAALEDATRSQVYELAQQLETARRKIALYETQMTPGAESVLRFAVEAYGAGEGTLDAVLRLETQLIGYRLVAVRARASALDGAAKLAFHFASLTKKRENALRAFPTAAGQRIRSASPRSKRPDSWPRRARARRAAWAFPDESRGTPDAARDPAVTR
ncbi:MAG: cobalt-zinc-cadmium efflux system outer membrane protein [Myxococcota bacterium]